MKGGGRSFSHNHSNASDGGSPHHHLYDPTAELPLTVGIFKKLLGEALEQIDGNLEKRFKGHMQQIIKLSAREGAAPWNMQAQLYPSSNSRHGGKDKDPLVPSGPNDSGMSSSSLENGLKVIEQRLTGLDRQLARVLQHPVPSLPSDPLDDSRPLPPHGSKATKLDLSDRMSDVAAECGPFPPIGPLNSSLPAIEVKSDALEFGKAASNASSQGRPVSPSESQKSPLTLPRETRLVSKDSLQTSQTEADERDEFGNPLLSPSNKSMKSKHSERSGALNAENVELHQVWSQGLEGGPPVSPMNATMSGLSSEHNSFLSRSMRSSITRALDDETKWAMKSKQCPPLIHPSATKKVIWDLFGLLLIAYDTVWLPLQLSFEPPPSTYTVSMFWITLIFWSTDIVVSFFTGFYHEGRLILRHSKIARNYATTWLLPDCLIVGLDWITVLLDSNRSGASIIRIGKSLRGIRVIRSLRLLRLMKVLKILEELQDRVSSDWLQIGLSLLQLTLMLLLLNHWIACAWWGIGRSTGQSSWTKYDRVEDEEIGYQYLTSLHWTLTQFTPAAMEVFPHNAVERAFAVIVLLFALLFFSSFLSSITSAMTRLRQLNYATSQQFAMLRRFLKEKEISQELTGRIKRYLEHKVKAEKARIQEQDVGILALLSEPLYKELQQQMYKPILCNHPFFDFYSIFSPHAMRQLCHSALRVLSLSEGDTVFTAGDKCERMLIVMDGELLYQWLDPDPEVTRLPIRQRPPPQDRYLQAGDYVGEACLWMQWVYVGTLRATTMSSLLAIDAEAFASVTSKHRMANYRSALYAQQWIGDLRELIQEMRHNDLPSKTKEEIQHMCQEALHS